MYMHFFLFYLHAIRFVVIEKKEVLVWKLLLNQPFPRKDHSIQALQVNSRLLCIFTSSKIKFLCVFGWKKEVFLPISKLSHNCLLSILLLERQHKSYTSWSIHFIMHGWNAFFWSFLPTRRSIISKEVFRLALLFSKNSRESEHRLRFDMIERKKPCPVNRDTESLCLDKPRCNAVQSKL